MPKKQLRQTVARSSDRRSSRVQLPPLTLVSSGPPATVPLEEDPESFDAEEDIASIIVMPRTIPLGTRSEITRRIGEKFETSEQLDAWLHTSDDRLGGDTPFERVISGDGVAVLEVLRGEGGSADMREEGASANAHPILVLVRSDA